MIVLPADGYAAILDHARSAYPQECCGLLSGTGRGDGPVRVRRVVPAANVAEERRTDRFEVDPQVHFDLMRLAESEGEEIVGHYHSHPGGPPEPSETDRSMAFEPDFIWLICAAAADNVGPLRAWRIPDLDARPEPVPLFSGGALRPTPKDSPS